jgi:hypothetical protein
MLAPGLGWKIRWMAKTAAATPMPIRSVHKPPSIISSAAADQPDAQEPGGESPEEPALHAGTQQEHADDGGCRGPDNLQRRAVHQEIAEL